MYYIEHISENEFRVDGHTVVYKDHNNMWISSPPIEDRYMKKVVHYRIAQLSKGGELKIA